MCLNACELFYYIECFLITFNVFSIIISRPYGIETHFAYFKEPQLFFCFCFYVYTRAPDVFDWGNIKKMKSFFAPCFPQMFPIFYLC